MRILFLVPYPLNQAPSQRFRFEQYLETLTRKGHTFRIQSFLKWRRWRKFAQRGHIPLKIIFLLDGLTRRLLILPFIFTFDFVFIHREAAPIGPPIIEWLIAKIFRKKIIYDFDDALWLSDRERESRLLRIIKWRNKVKSICRWSHKVTCGNKYLYNYSLQFNKNVIYNPTTIDTEFFHNPGRIRRQTRKEVIIGWTGSSSTLKYLKTIERILQEIERDFPFVKFMVIADRKADLNLNSLVYKPWSAGSEIEDLYQFDIGIMPLPDNAWTKGKCGFKALQYMALEIPTVASATGANNVIIDHSIDGFLASSDEDWKNYLSVLISDKQLRLQLGKHGREKIIDHYSVRSNSARFLSLFT